MNTATITPLDDWAGCPFPFFDEETPAEGWYKITHDGGHFVATRIFPRQSKHVGKGKTREDIDICFDSLYTAAVRKGLKDTKRGKALTGFITAGMEKLYSDNPTLDEYIADRIKRKRRNLYNRKKRFRRKAYLNKWNYFITVTYFYGHYFQGGKNFAPLLALLRFIVKKAVFMAIFASNLVIYRKVRVQSL